MNGYSKIKHVKSKKSKSPNFPDLSSPQQSPKHFSKSTQNTKDPKPINDSRKNNNFVPEANDDDENGERFGVILSRTCSVSSASKRHRYENNGKTTSIQSAVRRAFSMSRSSSVSERYSRIHDQGVTLASSPHHENEEDTLKKMKEIKKKSKSGKILKACKSLFRF